MKKRVLTAEQEQAAEVRKERFNNLCAWLKTLGAEEKAAIVARAGAVVTVENRALSPRTTILCFYQRAGVTMVGCLRQWLAKGRIYDRRT